MELFLAKNDRIESLLWTIARFYHPRLQHLLPPLFTAFNPCWMLVLPMPVLCEKRAWEQEPEPDRAEVSLLFKCHRKPVRVGYNLTKPPDSSNSHSHYYIGKYRLYSASFYV